MIPRPPLNNINPPNTTPIVKVEVDVHVWEDFGKSHGVKKTTESVRAPNGILQTHIVTASSAATAFALSQTRLDS